MLQKSKLSSWRNQGGLFADAAMRMNMTGPESAAINPVTASRLGGSRRYNAQGYREFAPENLAIQSQNFNTGWSKQGAGTGLAPVVTSGFALAPDGTMTADRIIFDSGAGTTQTDQSYINQSINQGNPHVPTSFYIWLKSNTASSYRLYVRQGNTGIGSFLVTPTWQKFFVKIAFDGTDVSPNFTAFGLRNGNFVTPATSTYADILAWGAQVDRSDVARAYIPTGATAVYKPRAFENCQYHPTTLQALGYLREGGTTNRLLSSNNLTNISVWQRTDTTITPNARIGASGLMDMDLVKEGTGTSANLGQACSINAGVAHTFSFDIARGNHDWVRIQCADLETATSGFRGFFNVSTGAFGALQAFGTGTIQNSTVEYCAATNIYRPSITGIIDSTSTNALFYVISALADGSFSRVPNGTRYQGCHQVEFSNFPTSYIDTNASTFSRAIDVCERLVGAEYNQLEGTVYIEAQTSDDVIGFCSTHSFDDTTGPAR